MVRVGTGWWMIGGALGWMAAPLCALAEPVASAASTSPAGSDPLAAGGILNLIISLLLVLGAIWGAAWLMRRLSLVQAPAGGEMRLLGGLAVGQRERVVLVQVGETQLLLGVAPGRVQTLHVLDKPIEVGGGHGVGFSERLAQVMGRGGAAAERREAPE